MTELGQLVAALAGLAGATAAPRLVGVGWATVDIERTLVDLRATDAQVTDDDLLLGARAWRVDMGRVALVLLEPNTEGRLAAALARRGEGITALYLAAEEPLRGVVRPTALGVPGHLSPQPHPWGPFLIEVSPNVPDRPSR